MLLPTMDTVRDLIGIGFEDGLMLKRPERAGPDQVSIRTLLNWKTGKTKPREDTVERLMEWLVDEFGLPARAAEAIIEAANEPSDVYRAPWDAVYLGASMGALGPTLEFREAKRLIDVAYDLKPLCIARDPQTLAATLSAIDMPHTDVTRAAIARLATLNDNSVDALGLACGPITLTNLFYLLACWDVRAGGVLPRVLPLPVDGGWKLPMARWLDLIREHKGQTNDDQLGALFLGHWSPDSRKREMKRWRKGELPSWKAVRKMNVGGDDRWGLYEGFAIIRLLHGLHALAGELERLEPGFSRTAFFASYVELSAYAKARDQASDEA